MALSEEAKRKARENGKKGGRPKGTMQPENLERHRVLAAFRQKAMQAAEVLFNRQLKLASGHMYLYKIEKKLVIGPKGGKSYIPQKPVRVVDEWEIEMYLTDKIVEGNTDDDNDPAATYYYITAEKGDNRALDSLLDRAFGKSAQVVVTEDEEGNQKPIQGNVITFVQDGDNS